MSRSKDLSDRELYRLSESIRTTTVSDEEGIRNFAFEKNSSVRGAISDVSISSSDIASILSQFVLEVSFIIRATKDHKPNYF
jgi:hypothetical protein